MNALVITVIGLVFLLIYYLLNSSPTKVPRKIYGIPAGPRVPGSSPIIRNWRLEGKEKLVDGFDDIRTLYDLANASCKKYGTANCLGTRPLVQIITEDKVVGGQKKSWQYYHLGPYNWINYIDFRKISEKFGAGLIALGLTPTENFAIYSETKAEWSIAAHGAFCYNMVVLTLYSNLGHEPTVFALNEGDIRCVLTNKDLITSLTDTAHSIPKVKTIICTEEDILQDQKIINTVESKGMKLYTFKQVVELGEKNPTPHVPPKPQDIAVIMYTSGSTGNPKGVMITHKNILASIAGTTPVVTIGSGEVYLSYLPLAHILSFFVEQGMIYYGNAIGYGNPRSLTDAVVRNCKGDISELRPTFFVGVPTVHERVKDGIKARVSKMSPIMQKLFKMAFKAKTEALQKGKDTPFWNKLIFNRFKAALGGRVRFIVSGGAPLSPSSAEFLHVCFGVPVVQGYGLTETCGASTFLEVTTIDIFAKAVGAPTLQTEVKLVDVPEMGYLSTDTPLPRGEIWIRGNGVTLGYYKNPQKTAEEFTQDGWFKTGDIGQLNENGTFSIIDRKKNLIKPPHGEYVAPERLESIYKNGDYIESVMVYASPHHNQLIAFVKPKKELQERFSGNESWEAFVESKEAEKAIMESLANVWKEARLKSIERISAVKLFPEEWTPQNEWLTAAMKLRRHEIHKKNTSLIERMYKKLEPQ